MAATPGTDTRSCPSCGVCSPTTQIETGDYACPGCGSALAHLDLAPNGMVRGVFGWLRETGEVLNDRYEIAGLLGTGGFAATYLADDRRLKGKRRAIKEIPEFVFDEQEVGILSRVQHPVVPDVTDRFQADGMEYLVLEFGGNCTLESARRSAGGKVPLPRVLRWGHELCGVLTYLHEQDPPIVHRDLKPENVLLDERDSVMLIDFGIAKQADVSTETRTVARSVSHGFSPPEQALGTGTDQRSDVYALAATLYVLLTGEVPPPAHERVAGTPLREPHEIEPEIPPTLGAALVKALDLNINARQQTIAELAATIDEHLGTSRTVAVEPPVTSGAGASPVKSPVAPAPQPAAPATVRAPLSTATGTGTGGAPTTAPRPAPSGRPRWLVPALAAAALAAVVAAVLVSREPGDGAEPDPEVPAAATGAGTAPAAAAVDAPLPRPAAAPEPAAARTGSASEAMNSALRAQPPAPEPPPSAAAELKPIPARPAVAKPAAPRAAKPAPANRPVFRLKDRQVTKKPQ